MTGSRSRRVRVRSADRVIGKRVVGLNADECIGRPPSAWAVILELRCGLLRSFRWYLEAHKGIPDPAVAEELCKLLSGSRYRIMIEDAPPYKHKGGRPSTKHRPPNSLEREVAEAYSRITKPNESDSAVSILSKKYQISSRTVYSYIKKVRDYDNLAKNPHVLLIDGAKRFSAPLKLWSKAPSYEDVLIEARKHWAKNDLSD